MKPTQHVIVVRVTTQFPMDETVVREHVRFTLQNRGILRKTGWYARTSKGGLRITSVVGTVRPVQEPALKKSRERRDKTG